MDAATRDHILDAAQALAQRRGFNAFSYRDVATEVGIRAPSIHYYFPSKEDLGVALVERYRQRFTRLRLAIDREARPIERLRRYAQLFAATLADGGKMCLCGMFAAELDALPEVVQVGIRGFFDENRAWLAAVLEDGRAAGAIAFGPAPEVQAEALLSALEGAMLAARVARDPAAFERIAAALIDALAPAPAPR